MKNIRIFLYFFGMETRRHSEDMLEWFGFYVVVPSLSSCEQNRQSSDMVRGLPPQCDLSTSVDRLCTGRSNMQKLESGQFTIKNDFNFMIWELQRVTSDNEGVYCNGTECFVL